MNKTVSAEKRKYTTITIPTRLFENIQDKIRGTGFSSVSDYATYILRETTLELSEHKQGNKGHSSVVDKLKALGYA